MNEQSYRYRQYVRLGIEPEFHQYLILALRLYTAFNDEDYYPFHVFIVHEDRDKWIRLAKYVREDMPIQDAEAKEFATRMVNPEETRRKALDEMMDIANDE